MKRETIVAGKFTLKSGLFRIADPCSMNDSNVHTLKSKKGTWVAVAERSSNGRWNDMLYVAELIVVHECCFSSRSDLKFEEAGFIVDVESGQAGVFDSQIFEDELAHGKFNQIEFNEKCSTLSCSASGVGVIEGGAISESGGSDGSYNCYFATQSASIVAIKIVFFEKDDDFDMDSLIAEENDSKIAGALRRMKEINGL